MLDLGVKTLQGLEVPTDLKSLVGWGLGNASFYKLVNFLPRIPAN